MLDVYLFGGVLSGVAGLFAAVMYLTGVWFDAANYADKTEKGAARKTLAVVVVFPIAVALWPLALLTVAALLVGYLLDAAELLPRRTTRAKRIEELERELGMESPLCQCANPMYHPSDSGLRCDRCGKRI
jgi:hypothetical protein